MASPRKKSRATLAIVSFDADLRSSLVHLPLSLYAPLLERGVPPQSIVVEIARVDKDGNEIAEDGVASIHKIYAGWTGMSAAPLSASAGAFSSTSHSSSSAYSSVSSVISVSSSLATVFSPLLESGSAVKLTLLRSPPLPIASRVDVVPLSPDDWEILSLNAEEVENNMLGQVRAGKEGMTVAVHVGRQGRTVCRFRIISSDPPTQSYTSTDASLPRACRLSTDTEIVIAPRSRLEGQEQDQTASQHHDIGAGSSVPTALKDLHSPASAQQYLSKSLYRILPLDFPPSSPLSPVILAEADARILSLAFGGNSSGQGRCAIIKTPCPSAPDVFTSSGKGLSSFILGSKHRSEESNGSQGEEKRPARATTSAQYSQIPDELERDWPPRHVWLSAKTREKLGVDDWDLVRFSAAAPSALVSRPSSPEQTDATESEKQQKGPKIAGVTRQLDACRTHLKTSFRSRSLRSLQSSIEGKSMPRTNAGLFLLGGSGSGKTSVARVLCEELKADCVATIFIDCAAHSEERLTSMRHLIAQWLSAAAWHSPSLLVLDNLDRIVPSDQEHLDSPRSGQIAESMLQKIKETTQDYAVYVIATAQSATSLHKSCTSAHVFGETIELKAPDKEARRDILQLLVGQRNFLQPEEGFNPVMLAAQTEGYLPADLRDLVERAVHESAIRSATLGRNVSSQITMGDFTQAQKGFTPLSLRDIKLTQSSTTWKDIGGLQETRRVLRETLEWPSKYAKIFEKCPLRLRSGLLLYGYPGCGKTLLAGAVAKECGLNFISVKGPEILNKYIGASEKSVRDLFDRAQAAKPCILFFDEFDSIAPKRGHDSTGVTDRVVNQLLTQMDGAEGLSGVYILAATSRPDLIDSALLRPGRLDKSLLCDLPSYEDRLDILQVIADGKIQLDETVNLPQWAQRTEGFSGADLQALLYNANLEAVHENMSAIEVRKKANDQEAKQNGKSIDVIQFFSFNGGQTSKTKLSNADQQALQKRMELILSNSKRSRGEEAGAEQNEQHSAEIDKDPSRKSSILVSQKHLEKCFQTTRQSVPREEQQRLHRIYQDFVGERDGKFPNGEASREVGARQSLM